MQRDEDVLAMSASEYVGYLEENFLFSKARTLGDRPWRVLGVLMDMVKLGLKPERAEDMRMIAEASSPKALRDVFRSNLKAIIRSLPQDEGTARLDSIPITCVPQDVPELQFRGPNALAALTPRRDPFILVHAGLSYCLHSMTKALTHCIVTKSSSDKPFNLRDVRDFVGSVAHYLKSGDAGRLSYLPFRASKSILLLQSLLVHGQEVFIIWHELTHHVLGHVGRCRNVRLNTRPPLDLTLVSRDQEEEFLADLMGAKFAYHTFGFYADEKEAAAAKVPLTLSPHIYAAPDIFLTFLDVFERILGRNWSPTDTHPSGAMRRAALRRQWNEQLPPQAVQFAEDVEKIFDEIVAYTG